jgi:hypothetical protein
LAGLKFVGNPKVNEDKEDMELQHVNVKLLLKNPDGVDLERLIPVFHSWIQDQIFEERLLDVADYRHVHHGPGVVLIGHEGDYSVDNTDGRLGVRYNRKTVLDGSNRDRLKQASRAVLNGCQRLEAEPTLSGKLRFNGQDVEMSITDRLVAPNRDETREALSSDFKQFADELFRGSGYSLSYESDARKLFSASLRTLRSFSVEELLENLV